MKRLFLGLCVVICLAACKKNNEYKTYLHNPELFSQTVHELNTVVMGNNFPPMVAARNYVYGSVAAYEVIASGDPEHYTSLTGQLNGFKKVSLPAANKIADVELAALLAYMKVVEAVTFPEGSMGDYRDRNLQTALPLL
jgi:hypothetical protein